MKKTLIWLSAAILGILLISCTKEDTETSFSLKATDFNVARTGGECSSTITIKNAPDDASLSFTSNMDWISDITHSTFTSGNTSYVTYKFTVDENTDNDSRFGFITVTYNYSGGYFSNSVYVNQGGNSYGDTDFTASDLVGTYTALGKALISDGAFSNAEWTLRMLERDDESVYIDGLLPGTVGFYEDYSGHGYSAIAYLTDDKELVIHSGLSAEAGTVTTYYATYYSAYTPCTQYNTETVAGYYSDSFPDLTFTCTGSGNSWLSDYGVLWIGCSYALFDTVDATFGIVASYITLNKISDDVVLPDDEEDE